MIRDVSGWGILGCTVDTVVVERDGSYGITGSCSNNVCRDDRCQLVMVDVIRGAVKVPERSHAFALYHSFFDRD